MLRRIAPWVFASLLACFPLSLQAVPFSVSGNSGSPGESVEVVLFEQDANILTATIEVLFDDSVLSLMGASLGDLLSSPPSGVAPFEPPILNVISGGRAVISLVGLEDVVGSGELLAISFDILPTALPGATDVSFQCLDESNLVPPGANFCAIDYNIPLTTGAVTVLASSTPIPLPSSAWLLALGLAAASVVRIRS